MSRALLTRAALALVVPVALVGAAACGGDEEGSVETVTVTAGTEATTAETTGPEATDTTATTLSPPTTTEEESESGEQTPPGFPNAAEQAVLDGLAPGVDQDLCTREPEDSTTGGAIAGVVCSLEQTDGVTAYYDVFRSRAATLAAYRAIRDGQGLAANTGRCEPPGRTGESGWTWRVTGESGRVACFRKNDRWWFVWAQPRTRTIGFARGPSARAVSNFWLAAGLLRDNADEDGAATVQPTIGS